MIPTEPDNLRAKRQTDRKVLSDIADLILKSGGLLAVAGFIFAAMWKVAWPYALAMFFAVTLLAALALMLLIVASIDLADRPDRNRLLNLIPILFFTVVIAASFCGIGFLFLETTLQQ